MENGIADCLLVEMKCPLTKCPIDSINPFDVAVLHNHHHRNKETGSNAVVVDDGGSEEDSIMCCLLPLVSNLYSANNSNSFLPAPFNNSIESIYDGISNAILLGEDSERNDSVGIDTLSEHYDVVSFKFNRHSYHLSVLKKNDTNHYFDRLKSIFALFQRRSNVSSTLINTLAQDRIGTVLGIDSKLNMKVLCKGKVIYPNKDIPPQQISQKLIEISKSDQNEKRRSPSLVVMGTRKGEVFVQKSSKKSWIIEKQLRKILFSKYSCYVLLIGSGVVFLMKRFKATDLNLSQVIEGEL